MNMFISDRSYFPVVGDQLNIDLIKELFRDYAPNNNIINWDNPEEIIRMYRMTISTVNYCDYAEIKLNSFYFHYPYDHYAHYLEKKLNSPEYPLLTYINKFAKILDMEDYPYYDFTATYFYIENGILKVAHEVIFVDPCNENDDGVSFLLFDNMKIEKYVEEVEKYFYDRFIRHLKLPDELKKPMYLMSEDEIAVFRMYLYE